MREIAPVLRWCQQGDTTEERACGAPRTTLKIARSTHGLTMIVAIYARKSTEQPGLMDEGKSITRQIAHARDYATKKGWIVADAHIYADDGISGAEFVKRP